MSTRLRFVIHFLFVTAILPVTMGFAQQWSWPDSLQNMQVLPSDWTGKRLSPVMRGFTRALGVRCSHCHVGEEGRPLTTYDFVSDENPNKDRAREMLRMLGDINDHLKKIEPSGVERVNMWCHTCHNGKPRPITLEDQLKETYGIAGIDSTISLYHALRKRHYGRGRYDFGERTLNVFGYNLLAQNDTSAAVKTFALNVEIYPESANTWDSLAEGNMLVGNKEKAIEYYRKSLELNPDNDNAKKMLEELKKQ
ncbi:MAG: c-type cytochrome [Calditrichia bacterium]